MRRAALLAAAVAATTAPLAARAAASAAAGAVIDTTNYSATAGTSYVNAAQCAGSATSSPMSLEWNYTGSLPTNGTYKVFASTALRTVTTGTPTGTYCYQSNDTTVSPQVSAGQIAFTQSDVAVKDLPVSGSAAVTAIQKSCDASQEGQLFYVCAHVFDASGTLVGFTTGKFLLQLSAPPPPTGVTAGSGDGRLHVSWTANTDTSVTVDHYVAEATPAGGTAPVASAQTNGASTSVAIDGLQNGTSYTVVVYAYSVGGNRGTGSAAATGTPEPTKDFWTYYKEQGGREEGGCASGSAGPLALAAVAALLATRRRK